MSTKAQFAGPSKRYYIELEESVVHRLKVEAAKNAIPLNQYANDVLKAAASKGKRK